MEAQCPLLPDDVIEAIDCPEATKPPGWVSEYERSVFTHGHVHWMAQKKSPKMDSHWRVTRRGLIVSFSVADETFGVVPLPPRVDYLGEYRLTELEGRLCLFNPIADSIHRDRRSYDLWLLRDDEAGACELRCRIDPNTASPEVARSILSRKASPVASMDDGRRILFIKKSIKRWAAGPFAYTPSTGNVERLPYSHMCSATLYEENVVSPGRPYEDILFLPAATQALCVH
uniref:F-box associated beta-propeller type 3 domain-containing protein n=1 Tax=Aegilops tauschii TaxID=37682 RepID=M8CKK7_AEGTA